MKQLLIVSLIAFSSVSLAETFTQADIGSVALDTKTMNLMMSIKAGSPCDVVASPQVIQDESQPNVLKIQAHVRKSTGACISLVASKSQVVNLPALVEMTSVKIQKMQTYTIRFEGTDAELIVPGKKLIMASIQPEFANE